MSRVSRLSHVSATQSTEDLDEVSETQAHAPRTTKDGFDSDEKRPSNWTPGEAATGTAASGQYNLTSRGGSVLSKPVINNIYLGDFWNTTAGKTISTHNDAFAKDVEQSSYMGVLAQYGVGKGSFAGSTVVPGASPKEVNESQIQSIVKQAIASGTQSSDPQTIHTVILPPGTILTDGSNDSTNGLGGYHGSYAGPDGKPVYYAAIVYGQGQNGIDFDGKPADAISIVESHEWSEAETDPDVNSPIKGKKLGWYNDQNGEIGDEAIDALPLKSVYGKVDGFAVQKEWSNKDQAFETAPKKGTKTNKGPIFG
ncbi:MAG: hypothetical protein JST54_05860 [Deltaproteobacteria bacterium]|nr:hypothetical protein [Deltaproteobacteria bacterium]